MPGSASTRIIGLDLSGPSNIADTARVDLRLDEDGESHLEGVELGVGDADILTHAADLDDNPDDLVVALDAPLSYNPGGGHRPADRALRDELATRGYSRNSVMPPTMTRMAYLSLRGISLARALEQTVEATILEAHPTSAMLFRDIPESVATNIVDSAGARRAAATRLTDLASDALPATLVQSDHTVAALAAATAGADLAHGTPRWRFEADPPHHPYDFVC
jgi:predicted nuclease with RNAse H fold